MATRLSPRNYLGAAFVSYGLVALGSLLFGDVRSNGMWLGIFASKNEFAFTMSVFVMLSFAVAIDRRVGQPTRAFGMLGLPVGVFMLVMGQSTGALVSSLAVLSLGTVLALFRYVPSFGRLLLTVLSVLAMAAILLVAWSFRAEIQSAFLGATGKDMTLTGRTELWEVAFGEIARHPLLGQGFKAVWVPGNPVAEEMWARFGISSKSGFHFHSTWISNTVEIGFLGIAIEASAFMATLVLVSRWAIAAPSVGSIFFAIFAVQQAMLSFVEVVAYDQFQNGTIMLVSALVFGWRFRTETVQAPVAARRSLGYGSRAGI
jgi:exopolysaccharide production protein ExoQ